jgi:hypothetical protein
MTYASVIARRRAMSGEPLTLRRQLSPRTRWQDIEWLLDLESAFADPDAIPALLYSRPRAAPGVRSRLEQTIEGGRWKYADCDFRAIVPFAAELKAPPWTAMLLERMTGERTLTDLLKDLQTAGIAPPGASPEEFTRFVLFLARNGFVELPDFPLARRDAREDIR